MDVIILPSRLADEPDLPTINQRLLTGEAALDWSQVKEASLEKLRVLLTNIDLVENSDILGIDSVPGDLAELVLQAIAPEVWETEPEVEQDTGNGEVSPYLCKTLLANDIKTGNDQHASRRGEDDCWNSG